MREYDKHFDGKGAVRSGNATLRNYLEKASQAVRNNDWQRAESIYNEIAMLASSLRESAEINDYKAMEEAK